MEFVSPLVSRSVPLEGESSAFPLPTVALLPASPSRTPSCDQRGHPPWNPRCFAAANQQTRSSRETMPAPTFFRNVYHFLAPHNSIGGVGVVNAIQSESWGRFGSGSSPTPFAFITKKRLPSKNASGRLNLRGRFSIPKSLITRMEMLPSPLAVRGNGMDDVLELGRQRGVEFQQGL